MVLKVMFLNVLKHVFLYRWWHVDVDCSLIGWHKMSNNSWIGYLWSMMCVWNWQENSFFKKKYRVCHNHLHLQVTKYCIFVFTVNLLLGTMCLCLVSVNTFSNTFAKLSQNQHRSQGSIFCCCRCSSYITAYCVSLLTCILGCLFLLYCINANLHAMSFIVLVLVFFTILLWQPPAMNRSVLGLYSILLLYWWILSSMHLILCDSGAMSFLKIATIGLWSVMKFTCLSRQ